MISFPCCAPEDDELLADEEQNCSEPCFCTNGFQLWMAVFSPELGAYFFETLSIKYSHRKQSQGFKSVEVAGQEDPFSISAVYRFERTPSSEMSRSK